MKIASIAAIATIVAGGMLPAQSREWLDAASYEVQFARDPQTLGSEPHLRCEVDACGLDDDALQVLDQAVWTELAVREDARHTSLAAKPILLAA